MSLQYSGAVTPCRHRDAVLVERRDTVKRMDREPVGDPPAPSAHHPCLRWASRVGVIALVGLLVACASPSLRSSASAPPPTLAQERQRLAMLFDGTPVVLAIDHDGRLRAEVPLKFCFNPSRAMVKPPLGALLERLAGSPATRGGAWTVAATGDSTSKGTALATERAASVRDYLVGHGAQASNVAVVALGASGDPTTGVRVTVAMTSGKRLPR